MYVCMRVIGFCLVALLGMLWFVVFGRCVRGSTVVAVAFFAALLYSVSLSGARLGACDLNWSRLIVASVNPLLRAKKVCVYKCVCKCLCVCV